MMVLFGAVKRSPYQEMSSFPGERGVGVAEKFVNGISMTID